MTLDYDPSGERGKEARDAGMRAVAANNKEWQRLCVQCVRLFPLTWEGIAEDWRVVLVRHGLTPTVPQAWGTLTKALLRHKVVEPTGKYRQMLVVRSHKRKSEIYRRIP